MRRFLLLSLVLHALLFAAVPEDRPLQPGNTLARPLALRLVVTNTHDAPAPARTASRPALQREPAPALTAQPAVHNSARTAPPQPSRAVAQALPPRPAQLAGSTPQPVASEPARERVQAAVRSALLANFSYPRRARLRGWQGTVVIALRILPAGDICNVRVASSSGIEVLDQAALRALREVRIHQAVAWLDGREMDMLIPVEYRLTDG